MLKLKLQITATFALLCGLFVSPGALATSADPFRHYSDRRHELKLIDEGSAALALRLRMIERAKKSIQLESFIFFLDDSSRLLSQALVSKLKRERARNPEFNVRILIDDTPAYRHLDDYHIEEFARAGIEVRLYNSNRLAATNRDHRKLLLIDGTEALSGGRNIGNDYFDLHPDFNFVDRDLWIRGPGVRAMEEVFDVFWNSKRTDLPKKPVKPTIGQFVRPGAKPPVDNAAYQIALRAYHRGIKNAAEYFAPTRSDRELRAKILSLGGAHLDQEPVYEADSVTFLSDRPDWSAPDSAVTGNEYYKILQSTRSSALIENPYFIPQSKELRILTERIRAGVAMSILLNSREATEESIVCRMSMTKAKKLAGLGATIHLYDGSPLRGSALARPEVGGTAHWNTHAKSAVFDGKDAWVGTMNMDPRSIERLNAEMAILVHDNPRFARALEKKIQARLKQAYQMDKNGRDPHGRSTNRAQSFKDVFGKLLVLPASVLIEDQF